MSFEMSFLLTDSAQSLITVNYFRPFVSVWKTSGKNAEDLEVNLWTFSCFRLFPPLCLHKRFPLLTHHQSNRVLLNRGAIFYFMCLPMNCAGGIREPCLPLNTWKGRAGKSFADLLHSLCIALLGGREGIGMLWSRVCKDTGKSLLAPKDLK